MHLINTPLLKPCLTIKMRYMKKWTPDEIKAFRQRLNLYQKDFAALLRVTEQYVCNLEKGVRSPSNTMRALLDCLEGQHGKKKTGKKGE